MNEAGVVLHRIFYPYGTRTLTYKQNKLAIKMVKLMEWWLLAKPLEGRIEPLMKLICEQQIIIDAVTADGKNVKKLIDNPQVTRGLLHLMSLFNVYDCTGQEMNALISLVMECIRHNKDKSHQYLVEPRCFKSLWQIYFDPLLIKKVLQGDALAQTNAIGDKSYRSLSRHEIHVQWTDDRKDKYIDGMVTPRERVNKLVHEALSACQSKEELLSLLNKINITLINGKYVLPNWLSLFRHLIDKNFVDVEIIELLFNYLLNINITDCKNELNQLILGLFELWPQLIDKDRIFNVKNSMVLLIKKLMLPKTSDSIELIEGLTKRICASTPARNNNNGHLCFYFLLKDLLPIYKSSDIIVSTKSIDKEIILWYADFILKENIDNESRTEHCDILLNILKYITKDTDDNYLKYWFDRALNYQNDEFIFQIITHSIYSSSTLATFVRQTTDEQIDQFLQCIQMPIASEFISTLLTIVEALAMNAQTHVALFKSDNFHEILTKRLLIEKSPLTAVRLVILLLDVGYSGYNRHALDIADFFIGDYSTIFLKMNFEGQSQLASIILFLSSLSNDDQTIGSPSVTRAQTLVRNLFSQAENSLDDDDDDQIDESLACHLFSLNKEIVKSPLRTKFIELLSPFIPDLMGLLGQSDRLKRESIKLLGQILDLSENERSSLTENLQSNFINEDMTTDPINAQQQQQQHSFFFSPETVNKLDVPRVRYSDFIDGYRFLNDLEQAEQRTVDKLVRDHLSQQHSNAPTLLNSDENSDGLVITATTRENVLKILEVLNDPIPILLEGNTGVGKSATVMEAARYAKRKLVRYNMSSRVTIDDLLGKIMLIFDKEIQMTRFQFVQGPFTKAFVQGHWILFDELNLAQDTVLQAIESALDTRQLKTHNTSSAQESIIVHHMHPNFRLFATQNPNTGFFKDKREKLSASFLSRFRPLVFTELPDSEWRDIVRQLLVPYLNDEADAYADLLVTDFNKKIKEAFNNHKQKFFETGPYAEISIRELLKWVNQLIWQKQNGHWPNDGQRRRKMLSFGAWCVYGARYRGNGRNLIENILTDNEKGGWGLPALQTIAVNINQGRNEIYLDDVRCSTQIKIQSIDNLEHEWSRIFALADLEIIQFNSEIWKISFNVHNDIHQKLLDKEFISLHGIYRIDHSWLWQWLTSAARFFQQRNEFARYGYKLYIGRFRHIQAHKKIRECFTRYFKNVDLKSITAEDAFIQPEIPYILTNRILSTLKQVSFDMNIKQPILVTGPEGCGKSDLLLTLGWLNGRQINQLNMTPETEPSALVGQFIPNENKDQNDPDYDKKLIWQDGCVTCAYTKGQWALGAVQVLRNQV